MPSHFAAVLRLSFVHRFATAATLALTIGLSSATGANAQEDAPPAAGDEPQATTATYRDWTLRCDNLPETPQRRVCEIVQAVRAPDGQAMLAQIVVGRPAPDAPLKLIVQLPAGVWLPTGARLATASGPSASAIFTRCGQVCVADADLDQALVDVLRAAAEPAILAFQDGNRTPIELPVSLNGFTAALTEAGK